MALYLNPNVASPIAASEASMGEWNPFSRPVLTSLADMERATYLSAPDINGSIVPLYTETSNKRAKWLAPGPALMYWPLDTSGVIPNIGSVTLPNLSLVNGALPSSTELLAGSKSIELNGVNAYGNTAYLSRTNLVLDPIFGNATIGTRWVAQGAGASIVRVTNAVLPNGETGAVGAASVPAAIADAGIGIVSNSFVTVPASSRVDAGVWVKGSAGLKLNLLLIEANEALGTVASQSQAFTATGAWQWIAINRIFGAEGKRARWRVTTVGATNPAGEIVIWGGMIESGRTTAIASTEQFPNQAQLTSGLAAYSGAANETSSDIGHYIRNASRTAVFAIKQQLGEVQNVGFYGDNSAGSRGGAFQSTAGNINYRIGNLETTQEKTLTKLTLDGANKVIAFVWDAPSKTVSLYVNGAFVATSAAYTIAPQSTNGIFAIGHFGSTYQKGPFGPFAYYNRALSAAEVAELV